MTKRAAIITLFYNNYNYGAVLQAYALSYVVGKYVSVCDVLKVDSYYGKTGIKNKLNKYKKSEYPRIAIIKIKSMICAILSKTLAGEFQSRAGQIKLFTKNRINSPEIVYNSDNIHETLANYDTFITGSDQVWNLSMNDSPIYWLDFVSPDKQKISYAASISMNSFTDGQRERVKQYLSDFSAISVREKQGKDLLDSVLMGAKAVHWTIDPTLLLSRDEWEEICTPRRIKEKYIFAHILGESRRQRRFVKKFAARQKLKIVVLPHIANQFRFCDTSFGDIRLYDVSPEDFISLIKHAEYVFTDSFHSSVFAGLYHKEFFVFKRDKDSKATSMNSRMYSLMEIFDTQDRVIEESASVEALGKMKAIDYGALVSSINEKKVASLEYLQSALQ